MMEENDIEHPEFSVEMGWLKFEPEYIQSQVAFVNDNKINSIMIDLSSFDSENLSFLSLLHSEIEELILFTDDKNKLDFFYGLKNLKNLIVYNSNNWTFDLNHFPQLIDLRIEWNKNIINLDKCDKLVFLSLTNYNPKYQNLKELSMLKNLEALKISRSRLQSLDGIQNLQNLKSLNLYKLRTLKSIDELLSVKNNLHSLSLDFCPNINDYNILESLTNLENLNIQNYRHSLNIDFAHKLEKLKVFSHQGTRLIPTEKHLNFKLYPPRWSKT
jgi:hypothetical protein